MPSFEPSIASSYPLLATTLVEVVFDGRDGIDHSRLTNTSRVLLSLVQRSRDAGRSREETLRSLAHDAPESDSWFADQVRNTFLSEGNLETARVLCVTTAFDNEAMWANYADGHSGCVLGFRHLPEHDSPLLAAKQVSYSDGPPVVGSGLEFLLYGATADFPKKVLEAICYTKKTFWSYEREWRAITWRPAELDRKCGDYKFYPDELESVTVGPRANADTHEAVAALRSRYPQSSMFRLDVDRDRYRRIPL